MNYPLISEYVEAIKAAEDNFEQLKHLRPVLGEDGEPVMTNGNFAEDWHAYYGLINYIFRAEDIIYNLPNDIMIEEKKKVQAMSPDSFRPNVIIKGNEAVLSYIRCFRL